MARLCRLTASGLHADAAVVLREYALNIDAAIDCLLLGHEWSEARRVLVLAGRATDIDTKLKVNTATNF